MRHVFRVKDLSSQNDTTQISSQCLSCNVSYENLSDRSNVSTCQYARASLSPDFSYYVLDCMGPSVPYSLLFSLPKNNFVKILDLNEELQERLSELAMPQTKYLNYQVLQDTSIPARVKLLLPPGYREEELYTFPLILRV